MDRRLNTEMTGFLQIMVGMGLFGTAAVFIRLIDLPAPSIVAAQGTLAALTLVGAHALRRSPRTLQLPRNRRLVLVLGILFAVDHLLFTAGIQRTTVANIITLVYLYPVLTALLATWLLKERMQRHVIVALMLGVAGTLALMYPSIVAFQVTDLQAIAMGLAVALLAAFERILVKRLHPSLPTLTVNTYKYGVIAILFIPGLLAIPGNLTPRIAGLLLGSALLSGVLAAYLTVSGVRKVEANKGAVLCYVEPVVALGLAWLVLAETLGMHSLLGASLVFTSGYLILRGSRPAPSRL